MIDDNANKSHLFERLDPNKFRVVLKLCQNHYMSIRNTGNYENYLSRLFDKNFVKATVFAKEVKELISRNFFQLEKISCFSTSMCTVCVVNCGNLFVFGKNFVRTTFLQTKLLNR